MINGIGFGSNALELTQEQLDDINLIPQIEIDVNNLKAQSFFEILPTTYDVVNNTPDLVATPLAPNKGMRISGTFTEPFARFGFDWLPGDYIIRLSDDSGYTKLDNSTEIDDDQVSLKTTYSSQKINDLDTNLQSQINTKVDKITGKQLSTEDYTTTEKTKLAGIATAATQNATDVYLLSRANHTGTQAISTVSGLEAELDQRKVINATRNELHTIYNTASYNGFYAFVNSGVDTINVPKPNGGSVAVSNVDVSGCVYYKDATNGWQLSTYSSLLLETYVYNDTYSKDDVDAGLTLKVDKVAGKQLSTEDYTTTEKTKLAGIQAGAEVNVQADWNQTDNTQDDFIKNKPSVYTQAQTDSLLAINSTDDRNRSNHTGTQAASTIVQDASNRFVSDTEKATWNGKADKTDINKRNTFDVWVNSVNGDNTYTTNNVNFPYQTLTKGLLSNQYPCKIHLIGQIFNQNITLASSQSNITIGAELTGIGKYQTTLSSKGLGTGGADTTAITTSSGFTRLCLMNLQIDSGSAIPFVFASGDLGRHTFDNVAIITTNASLMTIPSNFENWIDLFDVDISSSASSILALPNLDAGKTATLNIKRLKGILNIQLPTSTGWTINVDSDCLLNFVGGYNTNTVIQWTGQPKIDCAGIITSQSALTTLLANAGGIGVYVVSGFTPSGLTGLARGDIIYHVGANINAILYPFSVAPNAINVLGVGVYMKTANDWTLSTDKISKSGTGQIVALPTISINDNSLLLYEDTSTGELKKASTLETYAYINNKASMVSVCNSFFIPGGVGLTNTVSDSGYATDRFWFQKAGANNAEGNITLNATTGVFTVVNAGTYKIKCKVFLVYNSNGYFVARMRNITTNTIISSAPHNIISGQTSSGIREIFFEASATFVANNRFAVEQTGGWGYNSFNVLNSLTTESELLKDIIARSTQFVEFTKLA